MATRPRRTEPRWRHIHHKFISKHKAGGRHSSELYIESPFVAIGGHETSEAILQWYLPQEIQDGTERPGSCRVIVAAWCNRLNKIIDCCTVQAMAILTSHCHGWIMADLSQNLGRMPYAEENGAFPCITSATY